jgi:hypothetical protein
MMPRVQTARTTWDGCRGAQHAVGSVTVGQDQRFLPQVRRRHDAKTEGCCGIAASDQMCGWKWHGRLPRGLAFEPDSALSPVGSKANRMTYNRLEEELSSSIDAPASRACGEALCPLRQTETREGLSPQASNFAFLRPCVERRLAPGRASRLSNDTLRGIHAPEERP